MSKPARRPSRRPDAEKTALLVIVVNALQIAMMILIIALGFLVPDLSLSRRTLTAIFLAAAVVVIAGACLGRTSGFAVGALAALASNFFFGQGEWTPLQMYAWGLIGYVAGVMGEVGLADEDGPFRGRLVYVWWLLSAFVYGLVMNGWYVIGYVRPIAWPTVAAAFAGGIPLDAVHGVSTVIFLMLMWGPQRRSIKRVIAKYGLG